MNRCLVCNQKIHYTPNTSITGSSGCNNFVLVENVIVVERILCFSHASCTSLKTVLSDAA